MPDYPLKDILLPIQDVNGINNLWCAYEHHCPPHIIYVNACKLIDVFKLAEARDNSEWFRMFANGGAMMIHLLLITDSRHRAVETAIARAKSLPTMPRCNLHGWNMKTAARPILCSNGKTYSTQREAADDLHLDQGNLSKHLRGKLKNVGGYTFAYASPAVERIGT
jgi:hypothetical protein